jgi:hypothetical protein
MKVKHLTREQVASHLQVIISILVYIYIYIYVLVQRKDMHARRICLSQVKHWTSEQLACMIDISIII